MPKNKCTCADGRARGTNCTHEYVDFQARISQRMLSVTFPALVHVSGLHSPMQISNQNKASPSWVVREENN